jgi:hypothetical protein
LLFNKFPDLWSTTVSAPVPEGMYRDGTTPHSLNK